MTALKTLLQGLYQRLTQWRQPAEVTQQETFSISLDLVGQRQVSPWMILAEMLLLPVLLFWVGLMVTPDDPLWLNSDFPWIWFAPLLLALRYGPLVGLGAVAVVFLLWLSIGSINDFPKLSFLGGLVLVMVVGEFSSLWLARTRRAETVQAYLGQRLESLTRQFYLLHLSHDRLEQDLISHPMSMRDALANLRQTAGSEADLASNSQALLRLLAQYCQIESAGVFLLKGETLDPQAVATMGQFSSLAADDPLLTESLASGRLCHIGGADKASLERTHYLIAAPLVNLAKETYGIVLVEKMPFFALQDEILQTINLFLGYFTDGMTLGSWSRQLRESYPLCPEPFAFELLRLLHVRRGTGVSSVIVALEIRRTAGSGGLIQQILRMKRALDEVWLAIGEEADVLATLMPLSNTASAEGYIARLETWAKQKGGKTLAEMGVFSHVHTVNGSPEEVLDRIMVIGDRPDAA
ncbi:MAG: PelD GGDEF domain-containing protein [Dechloromonas sp.]|nr:PelD GGDEF domain-containing protein [Dechloromonas sp.]